MDANYSTDSINKKPKLDLSISNQITPPTNQSDYFNTAKLFSENKPINKDLTLINDFTNTNRLKFITFNIKTYISKLNQQIRELKQKNNKLLNQQSQLMHSDLEKEELIGELIKADRLTNRLEEAYKEEFNELNNELKKYKMKFNNLEIENRNYKAMVYELIKRIKPQNEAGNIIEQIKKELLDDKQ